VAYQKLIISEKHQHKVGRLQKGLVVSMVNWNKVRENYAKWWDKELDRPLIAVRLWGKDPGRPMPDVPSLTQATCADLSIPAEDIIDRLDYDLSCVEYLGDAFPYVSLTSFGPGVVAAFLGAKLDNSSGRVWFHPEKLLPINEIHLEYDPDNIWLHRIKDICRAGMERWQGQVMIAMPDLGGVMDILSTFRPSENLLLDLYDEPEEVQRLVGEIHDLWIQFYEDINSVLQPVNPGYCDWAGIFSDKPGYVLQSDFSYMISPEFFDTFVKEDIRKMCCKLDRTMYHLDGVGQLNHLDSILEIEELDAVQWVPGDGRPSQREWPQVLQKIRAAGKNLQITEGIEGFDTVVGFLGTAKGLQVSWGGAVSERERFLEALRRYRVING